MSFGAGDCWSRVEILVPGIGEVVGFPVFDAVALSAACLFFSVLLEVCALGEFCK